MDACEGVCVCANAVIDAAILVGAEACDNRHCGQAHKCGSGQQGAGSGCRSMQRLTLWVDTGANMQQW
jgi:hypothetical protein